MARLWSCSMPARCGHGTVRAMLPSALFRLPAETEVMAPGQVLRRRNEVLTCVLHLESGRVLHGILDEGLVRHQLGAVEGPFWLDAASARRGLPFPVDMVADTRVQVRRLPIEGFRRSLAKMAPGARGLLLDMAQGYRQPAELAARRPAPDAPAGGAPRDGRGGWGGWVVMQGGADHSGALQVTLGQRKRLIAAQLGIVPETFSRVLRHLREQGLIHGSRDVLDLPQTRALQAMAGGGARGTERHGGRRTQGFPWGCNRGFCPGPGAQGLRIFAGVCPLRTVPMPTSAPPQRACDAPMSEFPAQRGTPGWLLPGALVLRLMLVTALALALSGALATWLVTQALEREAVRQLVGQQTDEVEVVARLLASKIEQSQKLLRTVAEGITPGMLKSPSALEWLLQQGLPAAQFFDTMQVAHASGQVRLSLRAGHLEQAADLDPAERDALRRTLVGGKPLVCELIAGGRPNEARVMFTMPLHHTNGSVLGVVAGALRLQSQSLLPPSMAWPTRDNSEFIVFTRDGTILSHSHPRRILGQVRDEAGLAPVYARWLAQAQPVVGRGITDVQPDYIASMAGMPLPQWIVARGVQTHPH